MMKEGFPQIEIETETESGLEREALQVISLASALCMCYVIIRYIMFA